MTVVLFTFCSRKHVLAVKHWLCTNDGGTKNKRGMVALNRSPG